MFLQQDPPLLLDLEILCPESMNQLATPTSGVAPFSSCWASCHMLRTALLIIDVIIICYIRVSFKVIFTFITVISTRTHTHTHTPH